MRPRILVFIATRHTGDLVIDREIAVGVQVRKVLSTVVLVITALIVDALKEQVIDRL